MSHTSKKPSVKKNIINSYALMARRLEDPDVSFADANAVIPKNPLGSRADNPSMYALADALAKPSLDYTVTAAEGYRLLAGAAIMNRVIDEGHFSAALLPTDAEANNIGNPFAVFARVFDFPAVGTPECPDLKWVQEALVARGYAMDDPGASESESMDEEEEEQAASTPVTQESSEPETVAPAAMETEPETYETDYATQAEYALEALDAAAALVGMLSQDPSPPTTPAAPMDVAEEPTKLVRTTEEVVAAMTAAIEASKAVGGDGEKLEKLTTAMLKYINKYCENMGHTHVGPIPGSLSNNPVIVVTLKVLMALKDTVPAMIYTAVRALTLLSATLHEGQEYSADPDVTPIKAGEKVRSEEFVEVLKATAKVLDPTDSKKALLHLMIILVSGRTNPLCHISSDLPLHSDNRKMRDWIAQGESDEATYKLFEALFNKHLVKRLTDAGHTVEPDVKDLCELVKNGNASGMLGKYRKGKNADSVGARSGGKVDFIIHALALVSFYKKSPLHSLVVYKSDDDHEEAVATMADMLAKEGATALAACIALLPEKDTESQKLVTLLGAGLAAPHLKDLLDFSLPDKWEGIALTSKSSTKASKGDGPEYASSKQVVPKEHELSYVYNGDVLLIQQIAIMANPTERIIVIACGSGAYVRDAIQAMTRACKNTRAAHAMYVFKRFVSQACSADNKTLIDGYHTLAQTYLGMARFVALHYDNKVDDIYCVPLLKEEVALSKAIATPFAFRVYTQHVYDFDEDNEGDNGQPEAKKPRFVAESDDSDDDNSSVIGQSTAC